MSPGRASRSRCGTGERTGAFAETTLDRVSLDLLIDGLPVREFRWYRGRQFYSGWYASSTTQGLVAYESQLELARILLADFDPAVVGIAAQPFQLIGEHDGRRRRHVPDLLLMDKSGAVTVVDVKPAHRLDDPQVAAVFGWTRRAIACRGWTFEVWSGAEETLLDNVRFLAGYQRRAVVCERLLPVALDEAASCGTLGELEHRLRAHAAPELVRPVVLHLIWSGALRADLHGGPLGVSTPLAVGGLR